MQRPLPTVLAGLATGLLLLGAAACGGDDDDSAGTDGTEEPTGSTTTVADTEPEGSGELAAYCEAATAIELTPPFEGETDAEAQAWVTDELQPRVEAVVAAAPPEIADDIATQAAAVAEAAGTGDFAAFGGAEVDAAEERTHRFDLDNCGWQVQDVVATEYSFGEIPATLEAGTTSFELDNQGTEVHEIVVARKNPGVTDSVEDLVADEAGQTKVTELDDVNADPGSADYVVVDLEPGEYIMVCFVPTGMTSMDAEPSTAPPHYTQGMVAEFTVS